MADITFNIAGKMHRTVTASAGSHMETLLRIARAHRIPISFQCSDGECGSCVVRVFPLSKRQRMGGSLSEKEKRVLITRGKLTQAEIDQMAVGDLPSPWRLACQVVIRDEDLLIEC